MKNKNPRVQLSRDGRPLGEYHPLQIGSMIETGFLKEDDLCLETESNEWIPLKTFLENNHIPGFARKLGADEDPDAPPPAEEVVADEHPHLAWAVAIIALLIAVGCGFWAWKVTLDLSSLNASLARAEAANAELKQKYERVLFAAREVASSDLVRGRVIIRKAAGKRVALPDIKVKLFPRKVIEDYLAERYDHIAEAGGSDPARLTSHFTKNLPVPVSFTTTDSDGRFELKVPEPGEYVIQTNIRSSSSGQERLWFVAFDSRDPLNTPVDINDANLVQQFNPLFMLINGR